MKDLIVIISKKDKRKRGDQIKTTIDRSAVGTGSLRSYYGDAEEKVD